MNSDLQKAQEQQEFIYVQDIKTSLWHKFPGNYDKYSTSKQAIE
jgi:hypothetical protein